MQGAGEGRHALDADGSDLALNLLFRETTAKGGIFARRKQAGWNDGYLLTVPSN